MIIMQRLSRSLRAALSGPCSASRAVPELRGVLAMLLARNRGDLASTAGELLASLEGDSGEAGMLPDMLLRRCAPCMSTCSNTRATAYNHMHALLAAKHMRQYSESHSVKQTCHWQGTDIWHITWDMKGQREACLADSGGRGVDHAVRVLGISEEAKADAQHCCHSILILCKEWGLHERQCCLEDLQLHTFVPQPFHLSSRHHFLINRAAQFDRSRVERD